MTVRISEQQIEHDGNTFEVKSSDGEVVIRWGCGDRYYFDEDGVRDAIEHVDTLAALSDVTLGLESKDGLKFYVTIDEDGDLYAATSPGGVGPDQDSYHVPWTELRWALNRALRSAEREAAGV